MGGRRLEPAHRQHIAPRKLLFGSDYTLEKGWYEGRPVLVTQNDYGLKLMNGDIGITLAVPDPRNPQQKLLRVAFPSSNAASDTDKPIRWCCLPACTR
ncbi:hypothetical protein HAALTHF_26290n [Vreelandella aquamarina]|nr:hypothetical protein HAALTHF_26290n [Halomonas axialensis]